MLRFSGLLLIVSLVISWEPQVLSRNYLESPGCFVRTELVNARQQTNPGSRAMGTSVSVTWQSQTHGGASCLGTPFQVMLLHAKQDMWPSDIWTSQVRTLASRD